MDHRKVPAGTVERTSMFCGVGRIKEVANTMPSVFYEAETELDFMGNGRQLKGDDGLPRLSKVKLITWCREELAFKNSTCRALAVRRGASRKPCRKATEYHNLQKKNCNDTVKHAPSDKTTN